MISVKDAICLAKECAFKAAEQRVNDVTFGFDKEETFFNLLMLNAYIDVLERYKCSNTCLNDEEICLIVEKINYFCSSCNCKCN